jgi:hypothetical protein
LGPRHWATSWAFKPIKDKVAVRVRKNLFIKMKF